MMPEGHVGPKNRVEYAFFWPDRTIEGDRKGENPGGKTVLDKQHTIRTFCKVQQSHAAHGSKGETIGQMNVAAWHLRV
jgi:hypothetical protein